MFSNSLSSYIFLGDQGSHREQSSFISGGSSSSSCTLSMFSYLPSSYIFLGDQGGHRQQSSFISHRRCGSRMLFMYSDSSSAYIFIRRPRRPQETKHPPQRQQQQQPYVIHVIRCSVALHFIRQPRRPPARKEPQQPRQLQLQLYVVHSFRSGVIS